MRRKGLIKLLMTALVGAMLLGCGKQAERTDSENVVLVEEESEALVEEEVEPEEPEQVEEPVEEPEPEPEPEPADWLEAHDITITPQGDCQVTLWTGESDQVTFVSDVDFPVNVAISETTEGADEGFKKVTAVFAIDLSNWNWASPCWKDWASAFDRYTGTSFEFDSSGTITNVGEHAVKEGYVTIQNGDEYYDVSIEFAYDAQESIDYTTITINCPVDYDGAVFQIGYASPEQEEQTQQIDFSARLYTIDELPFYGNGYLYFTMSNE